MVPTTCRASSFLEKNVFLKTNIKLVPFLYALLSSSVSRANLSCVISTIFSSLAFLSSSVSMANLSSLVGTSFSSYTVLSSSLYTTNQSCLLATSFSSLRVLSNSFSSPRLRVVRCSFSLSSVSDNLFFYSCSFFVLLLALSYSRLILSLSLLCSSVALFALSFSFLSNRCFFRLLFRPC